MNTYEARASTNETLFGCDVKTTYTTGSPVRQAFFHNFGEIEEKAPWSNGLFRGICTERGRGDSRIARGTVVRWAERMNPFPTVWNAFMRSARDDTKNP